MTISAAPLACYEFDNSGVDAAGTGPTLSLISGAYSTTSPKLGTHSLAGRAEKSSPVGNLSVIPSGNHSITCWTKVPLGGSSTILVRNGANVTGIALIADVEDSENLWVGDVNGMFALDTGVAASSSWMFIAVSWNGTDFKAYVNNSLIGTATTPIASSASAAIVSAVTNNAPRYLDQLALFDFALSADDVAYLYNSGNGLAYASWEVTAPPASGRSFVSKQCFLTA